MLKKLKKGIEHLTLNECDSFTFLSFHPYPSMKKEKRFSSNSSSKVCFQKINFPRRGKEVIEIDRERIRTRFGRNHLNPRVIV